MLDTSGVCGGRPPSEEVLDVSESLSYASEDAEKVLQLIELTALLELLANQYQRRVVESSLLRFL